MHKELSWLLESKRHISESTLKDLLSDDAYIYFMRQHEDVGFFHCIECNYYINEKRYNKSNLMCHPCYNNIMKEEMI